jgi:hypothetical protein
MSTPKDNLALEKHLLDVRNESAAIDKERYILAKAMDLQHKADTS